MRISKGSFGHGGPWVATRFGGFGLEPGRCDFGSFWRILGCFVVLAPSPNSVVRDMRPQPTTRGATTTHTHTCSKLSDLLRCPFQAARDRLHAVCDALPPIPIPSPTCSLPTSLGGRGRPAVFCSTASRRRQRCCRPDVMVDSAGIVCVAVGLVGACRAPGRELELENTLF